MTWLHLTLRWRGWLLRTTAQVPLILWKTVTTDTEKTCPSACLIRYSFHPQWFWLVSQFGLALYTYDDASRKYVVKPLMESRRLLPLFPNTLGLTFKRTALIFFLERTTNTTRNGLVARPRVWSIWVTTISISMTGFIRVWQNSRVGASGALCERRANTNKFLLSLGISFMDRPTEERIRKDFDSAKREAARKTQKININNDKDRTFIAETEYVCWRWSVILLLLSPRVEGKEERELVKILIWQDQNQWMARLYQPRPFQIAWNECIPKKVNLPAPRWTVCVQAKLQPGWSFWLTDIFSFANRVYGHTPFSSFNNASVNLIRLAFPKEKEVWKKKLEEEALVRKNRRLESVVRRLMRLKGRKWTMLMVFRMKLKRLLDSATSSMLLSRTKNP